MPDSMLTDTSFVLKRYAAGTYVNHRFVAGTATTSSIYGNVQPLSTRELQLLPEGIRSRARYNLYTETELKTAIVSPAQAPDVVVIDSLEYEVHIVKKEVHFDSELNHYEYVLVLRETE